MISKKHKKKKDSEKEKKIDKGALKKHKSSRILEQSIINQYNENKLQKGESNTSRKLEIDQNFSGKIEDNWMSDHMKQLEELIEMELTKFKEAMIEVS